VECNAASITAFSVGNLFIFNSGYDPAYKILLRSGTISSRLGIDIRCESELDWISQAGS